MLGCNVRADHMVVGEQSMLLYSTGHLATVPSILSILILSEVSHTRMPNSQNSLQLMALLVQPAEWMMSGTLGALAVVAAAVVRIYLGWAYVGNRLLSAAVEYEETGWSVFSSCLHALCLIFVLSLPC